MRRAIFSPIGRGATEYPHTSIWRVCRSHPGGCFESSTRERCPELSEIWPAMIGVCGALLGSLLGGWLTSNATQKSREVQRKAEERDRLLGAIADALNAVLAYRAAELRRAHEVVGAGIAPNDAESVLATREARRSATYRLTMLRILMPHSPLARDLDEVIQEARSIGHSTDIQSALTKAASVTKKVESLAVASGRELLND